MIKISKAAFISIILLACAMQLPPLILGGGGYDYIFHMVWSTNFTHQFWGGELYPRWMMNMNAGCGGPDFFFYSPVAFYLNSIFYSLNGFSPEGWYPLLFSVLTILILSGISFYKWIRNHVDDYAAIFAASMYLLSPYFIYDNYMRFAFTEMLTFIWIPMLLHITQKIISGKTQYWAWFAIVYALQIMSNIPGTIVVSCLIAFYFLFFASKDFYIKGGAIISAAVLLACGISAIYILPVAHFYSDVQLGGSPEVNSLFTYTKALLFNINNNGDFTVDTEDIFLLVLTLVTLLNFIAIVFLWYAIVKKSKNKQTKKQAHFWLLVGFLAVFMMTPYSTFLYTYFPVFQMVRHPIRFGIIHTISAAVLLGILVSMYKTKEGRSKVLWNFTVGVMCIIIPISYMVLINSRRPFDEPPPTAKDVHIFKYHKLNMVLMHEYIPINTDVEWVIPENIDEMTKICSKQTRLMSGKATAEVIKWQPRDIELNVNARTQSILEIGQFWFPAWSAKDSDSGQLYEITPSKNHAGIIEMKIPKGEHKISLKMETTMSERLGLFISLVSVFAAFAFLKKYRRKK